MDTVSAAANHHVRVMEARIEKQKELVQQLEAAGADPAEQIQRLDLLMRAFGGNAHSTWQSLTNGTRCKEVRHGDCSQDAFRTRGTN
jgi:hypothetical protein